MGNITILPETTKKPITLIGKRAGVCWNSDITDDERNYKRGMDCIKSNHGRTLEFVNVEMVIDGYSARVAREYFTHIGSLPSRLQESTRYINYKDGFDYIIPESIKKNPYAEAEYRNLMYNINRMYASLIEGYDIPKEDAAMCLPLGMTTKIVDKRNLRNLIDMAHQRMCSRAYWEFRELFGDICKALAEYSDEWTWIVNQLFVPKCKYLGYCPESKSCGRVSKKDG
jgi:thymidylate synthase (FAD)